MYFVRLISASPPLTGGDRGVGGLEQGWVSLERSCFLVDSPSPSPPPARGGGITAQPPLPPGEGGLCPLTRWRAFLWLHSRFHPRFVCRSCIDNAATLLKHINITFARPLFEISVSGFHQGCLCKNHIPQESCRSSSPCCS